MPNDCERFAGVLSDGEAIFPTWSAVISKQAVNVIFAHRHWERIATKPAWADGRSALEADIDGVAESVRKGLRLQLGLDI